MGPLALRATVLVALVAAAVAVGLWRRKVDGRSRAVTSGVRLTAADLGHDLGVRATLLQFSALVCAPCRATGRILADVVKDVPGVVRVEVDAAEHLPLARRLAVLRTPTVLVLDPTGRVVARTSGVPSRPQVMQALAMAGAGHDSRAGS